MSVSKARYGQKEWTEALERFMEYVNHSESITPREAFKLAAKVFGDEHFGVESVRLEGCEDDSAAPAMEYLNQGDTYDTTLILTDDYVNGDKLLISSWGDWYEEQEQWYCKEKSVVRCGYCGRFTQFEYGADDWSSHDCEHCGKCVSG